MNVNDLQRLDEQQQRRREATDAVALDSPVCLQRLHLPVREQLASNDEIRAQMPRASVPKLRLADIVKQPW